MTTRRLRKYFKISTWIRLTLVIFSLQLLLCLIRYAPISRHKREEMVLLNENLTDYQFIEANFPFATEGSWQNIGGAGIKAFKFLVYSAFLDIRTERTVRVIAVTRTQKRKTPLPNIWCKLWYKTARRDFQTETVEGKPTIIKENWGLPYSAYYVACPCDKDDRVPDAVSLVSTPDQTPENLLKVLVNYDAKNNWDPAESSPLVVNMAVCVKPLHYDYNRVIELLEFVELHRLMGVDHFYLYNHTVGPQVSCLLEKYQNEGIVTVLSWQLPVESQKEIRTEGIFASLNDCLYRTMHKYSHSIFIDFDEFIIPTNNYSYRQLFDSLDKLHDIKHRSAFSFRNAFFYRQWPDDQDVKSFNDPIAENLVVLRKTTRKTELHKHRTRSKVIVRPELINMVGNHFVWEYYHKKEFGNMEVDPRDAFMHHYRTCEFGGDDCVTQPSTVDKTAYRYKDELIMAVKTRYNEHLTECKLESISDLGRFSNTSSIV